MEGDAASMRAAEMFEALFAVKPAVIASAPGRLEVLGNHTDYNGGLTLSCAVDLRCDAVIAPLDEPVVRLASTGYRNIIEQYPLSSPTAPAGHWANYVLGLVAALQQRGHGVPGLAMLVDSQVPESAGLSSSAAVGVSAVRAIDAMVGLSLSPLDLARVASEAESVAAGAQTGLLDQLSSLLGGAGELLEIDFSTLAHRKIALPEEFCFAVIDSGEKHDLTAAYNQRREACESAVTAVGEAALRQVTIEQLSAIRNEIHEQAYRCARHVIDENTRVQQAVDALGPAIPSSSVG